MIQITANDQSLERAKRRALTIHNTVKVLDLAKRIYSVTSRRSGQTYNVRLLKSAQGNFASCTCQAGLNDQACHHVPSVILVNNALMKMRQATQQTAGA